MRADNMQAEDVYTSGCMAAAAALDQAAWDQAARGIEGNMQSPEDVYAAGVSRGFALAAAKGVGKTRGGQPQQWAADIGHGVGGRIGGGMAGDMGGGIGGVVGGGVGAGLPPMPCGISPTPDQQWWPCHFWEQRELDEQGGTCHGWAITSHKGSKKTRWVCAHCARLLAAQRQFSQDGGSPGGGDHFGPGGSPGGGDHFGPGGSGPGNGFGSDQYWLNRLPVVEARLTR